MGRVRPRGVCAFCCGVKRIAARSLCVRCYYLPDVRKLYPPARPRWTGRQLAQVAALRGRGLTAREIARLVGRTRDAVRRAFRLTKGGRRE